MSLTDGVLYVTAAHRTSLSPSRFHDWFLNQYGPSRLKRRDMYLNGDRYRATDQFEGGRGKPEWLAVFDVQDVEALAGELSKEDGSIIGDNAPEKWEQEVLEQISVKNQCFKLLREWKSNDFSPHSTVQPLAVERNVLSVTFTLNPGYEPSELEKWYGEEHVSMLMKVPGWVRTRRFVSIAKASPEDVTYLALHEFESEEVRNTDEFKAAISTEWSKRVYANIVSGRVVRDYTHDYTFSQASRDLMPLTAPDIAQRTSKDGLTHICPSAGEDDWPIIESTFVTRDGVSLPYRLEGAWRPDSSLILLSNCILSDWGIWDEFVKKFLSSDVGKPYRIARYNTRGRYNNSGSQDVDIDVLSADVVDLLDTLRVAKAAALVGVSMGGCTVMNTALKHPNRTACFLSSDSASVAAAGNKHAWEERIAVSEKQQSSNSNGDRIVGSELAELTVQRWFSPHSHNDPAKVDDISRVRKMVESNSFSGFKAVVPTLYAYDLKQASMNSAVKAMFVVGADDGVLPSIIEKMSEDHGSKVDGQASFRKIEKAGHLPPVENCTEFLHAVESLLKS